MKIGRSDRNGHLKGEPKESVAAYGDAVADLYDQYYDAPPPDAAVDFLMSFVERGVALELGGGTGRIAIPLACKGVQVHTIEVSKRMIEILRSKPGSEQVTVHRGSFATISARRTYSLIYAAWNAIYFLRTQEEQLRCLRAARRALTQTGRLVIEAFVPRPDQFIHGMELTASGSDFVWIADAQWDIVAQTVRRREVFMSNDVIRVV